MNILFITPRAPWESPSGGTQVSLERLRGFAACHAVTVLCLESDAEVPPPADLAVRVVRGGKLRSRTAAGLFQSYAAGVPLSVWRNQPEALLRKADELGAQAWDIVYCDHWLMWPAAVRVPGRRILHLHNAEHLQFSRAADSLKGPTKLVAQLESGRVARYIRQIVAASNELHLLSPDDQLELQKSGIVKKETRVFLPSAELVGAVGTCTPPSGEALFLGSLSWQPNQDGLHWMLTARKEGLQGVNLTVAGRGCPLSLETAVQEFGGAMLGFVADADPLYANARAFVAPLRSGSGIKIKILNAMARGVPVVTTPTGVEGFPSPYPEGIRVATTPEEFLAEVRHLATVVEDKVWERLSGSARGYVKQHFTGAAWREWCRSLQPN